MEEELRLRRLASALASEDHRREVEERADQLRQVRLVSLFQKVERSFGATAPTSAMIKSNHGEKFSLLMFYQVWSATRDDIPGDSDLVDETRTVTVTVTTNINVVGI